jgi:hypothetical protein
MRAGCLTLHAGPAGPVCPVPAIATAAGGAFSVSAARPKSRPRAANGRPPLVRCLARAAAVSPQGRIRIRSRRRESRRQQAMTTATYGTDSDASSESGRLAPGPLATGDRAAGGSNCAGRHMLGTTSWAGPWRIIPRAWRLGRCAFRPLSTVGWQASWTGASARSGSSGWGARGVCRFPGRAARLAGPSSRPARWAGGAPGCAPPARSWLGGVCRARGGSVGGPSSCSNSLHPR